MADTSFSDRLGGGTLQGVTEEGGGIAPTTPLGALAAGASPDAAKMVGTPAQKEHSLSESLSQFRAKQRTAQAEARRAEEGPAKGLLSEAQRITPVAAFAAKFPKLAVQYALSVASKEGELLGIDLNNEQIQTVINTSPLLASKSQAELDAFKNDLSILARSTDPSERASAMARIATTWGSLPTSADLAQFFTGTKGQSQDEIRRIFAAGTKDLADIKVGEVLDYLDQDQLFELTGFRSKEELAVALNMAVQDLDERVTMDVLKRRLRVEGESFGTIGELRHKLASGNISEFERRAALERLRELGLTGTLGAFDNLTSLDEEILKGESIEFDGEMIRVEEILSDDWLMSRVEDALLDPLEMDRLRNFSPEFADWVERNRLALEGQLAQVGEDRRAVANTTEQVRSLNQISGIPGLEVPDSLMRDLVPGWDNRAHASVPSITNRLYTDFIQNPALSAAQRQQLMASLTTLQSAYPDRYNFLLEAGTKTEGPFRDTFDRHMAWILKDPAEYEADLKSFRAAKEEISTHSTAEDISKFMFGLAGISQYNQWLNDYALNVFRAGHLGQDPTADQLKRLVETHRADFTKMFMDSYNNHDIMTQDMDKSPKDFGKVLMEAASKKQEAATLAVAEKTRREIEAADKAAAQRAAEEKDTADKAALLASIPKTPSGAPTRILPGSEPTLEDRTNANKDGKTYVKVDPHPAVPSPPTASYVAVDQKNLGVMQSPSMSAPTITLGGGGGK